jgi:hypothetical protein
MKRSLWLLAVLLSLTSFSPNVIAQTSCNLPKAAQVAPGQEVSITCTNLQAKDAKVPVVLTAKDQTKTAPLPGKAQDNTVTFTVPGGTASGLYSVALTIDSKAIDVPSQLEVVTPTIISCGKLPHVAPGEQVEITECKAFSGEQRDVPVSLKSADGKVKSANDGVGKSGSLTFLVPSDTQPGQYSITADNRQIQGQMDVMGPVAVDTVYPGTTYPLQKGFNFKIEGKNFSTDPKGNKIELVDEGILGDCEHNPPLAGDTPCVIFSGTASSGSTPAINPSSTTEIVVSGFYPKHYYGPAKMVVHVGDGKSAPVSVTFAPVSQQGVALAAAFVFFVVAYILYRLVTKGLKGDIVNGVKLTPWASLFLDRETNSYSLSKFQVIAWTAITVYSYVYIFLCRTLIQGDFKFPDVSQNLPQLFFVSAGTTVAAAAITATVGSKGAGPIQPSAADFISTGGLVAGDRFQFFTWTIVGCIGYLYLVIRMNPETPNISLPDIPQNFLYLMGVSSAGYLGGKVVRKPGPVIKMLSVAKVAQDPTTGNVLTLNLKGENLDPKGQVKVDNIPLRGDLFQIDTQGQPDPQAHFCSEMNISLFDAAKYIEGTHELMLVNQDGQSATVGFPADPTTIDPIPAQIVGDAAVNVSITGKNFVDGMKFEWKDPAAAKAGATMPTGSGAASIKSGTQLVVSLVPGKMAGTGKLTLISPISLRATADVSITGPTPSTASVAVTTPAATSITVDRISIPAGNAPVNVPVTGTNFVDGTKFEWRNPAEAQQPNDTGPAIFTSATALTVRLTPGVAGTGKLKLTGPSGQLIETNVTVTVS